VHASIVRELLDDPADRFQRDHPPTGEQRPQS
jgi:hypothetical protein